MAVVRAARDPGQRGGRKPIAEQYRPQINRTLRVFGDNMPELASAYVSHVDAYDPELCPEHDTVLGCPECDYRSQRKFFDHRAAQYVFDRIMGKPTTRSENTLTVNLVQQVVATVLIAFGEVNALPDAATRQQAFARRCLELSAGLTGTAA